MDRHHVIGFLIMPPRPSGTFAGSCDTFNIASGNVLLMSAAFLNSVAAPRTGFLDGTYTINVQHADDDGAGSPDTYSNAAAVDLVGSEGALSAANSRSQIGYVGEKKFVRLQVVSTSTSSGATVGGTSILGDARHES